MSRSTIVAAFAAAVIGVVSCTDAPTAGHLGDPTSIASQDSASAARGAKPWTVASINVFLAAKSRAVGQTTQATYELVDAYDRVIGTGVATWSSDNKAVATVSSSGLVTAVSNGTARIQATYGSVVGSATLTVTGGTPVVTVASVSVALNASALTVGQTTQATATARDASGSVLSSGATTWSSSSPAVATVSASGLVTAVAPGTATITATSGGKSGTAPVTVTAVAPTPVPPPVASVTLSPATATVTIAKTQQLTATLRDASGAALSGRAITWISGSPTVATVSATGLVTALSAGTAIITATSDGVAGTASITVPAPVPPPTLGVAPEPGAGDVMLWQDDFNKSTFADLTAGYAKRGVQQLIQDGRTGQAIRFPYSAGSFDNLIEKTFTTSTDLYFRFWYRLSPGADPTCGGQGGSGMKWFMAWRPTTVVRYTMGVGSLSNGPTGRANLGNEFTAHDNTSIQQPNPFLSNVNNSIRFSTTNDYQWHKYTLHIVTGNGGYEQIWVDGTLVLDNSAFKYDHDPVGINMIQFPGTLVQWFAGCDFTIDVDDLAVWHK